MSRVGKPRRAAGPGDGYGMVHTGAEYDDMGGASRFYPVFRYDDGLDVPFRYVAKAGRKERDEGLKSAPTRTMHRVNAGGIEHDPRWAPTRVKNNHPTVKPVALMRWLCRLVTPPGGVVVDPFTGSGSTGVAALREGFRFFGCEENADYVEIAQRRIAAAAQPRFEVSVNPITVAGPVQTTLFEGTS